MDTGARRQMALRHYSIDERGTGLRATWHRQRGFVNLSLWRDDVCVETFHLAPHEAADLLSFLAHALADAAPEVSPSPVSAVPDLAVPDVATGPVARSGGVVHALIARLARARSASLAARSRSPRSG